ncbi:MAG TPA: hypothetical protein ACFYEK_14360 [Candidatus Wunengus sp. YC60]|uniref:hypothetical protein n=1 Tax=Candidatus Wunengus sp. YC60 TaxID=3367697 RepID=UPI00402660C1
MSGVIADISGVLIATLIIGSIATLIYFVFAKVTKRAFRKKTVLMLYLINLVVWSGIVILMTISSKVPKEQIIGPVSVLVFIGIIVFFAWLGKARKKAIKGIKETRCTCQACGNVWYYGKGEYLQNIGQNMINSANRHGNAANDLLCCSGCWPAAFLPKNQEVPVKDLNKCPKCNSSAINKEEVIHDFSK